MNVNGDSVNEPNETFTVVLSAPTNATIGAGTGTGTIQNDDAVIAAPVVAIPTFGAWAKSLLALILALPAWSR